MTTIKKRIAGAITALLVMLAIKFLSQYSWFSQNLLLQVLICIVIGAVLWPLLQMIGTGSESNKK